MKATSSKTGWTLVVSLMALLSSGAAHAESFAKAKGERGLIGSWVQLELAYAIDFIVSSQEFSAIGEWNADGNQFDVATRANHGFLGAALGLRLFPFSQDQTGFAVAMRAGFTNGELTINWVNAATGEPIESSDMTLALGAGLSWRAEVGTNALGEGRGLFLVPEVGVEYLQFLSTPDLGEEETSDDSFAFEAPAAVFRLALDLGIVDLDRGPLQLMVAGEYHLPFAFAARRELAAGDTIEGNAEGTAGVARVMLGVSM